MAPPDDERTERIATSVDNELKQTIRVEAAQCGMSMSELVREILIEEFDDAGNSRTRTAATTCDD